jgi:hypothetical protein
MSKPWNELTEAERAQHYLDLAAARERMSTEPLLPCPFCGNLEPARKTEFDHISDADARHGGLGSSGGSIARHKVVCLRCGAQHQAPNPDSLHWNSRF